MDNDNESSNEENHQEDNHDTANNAPNWKIRLAKELLKKNKKIFPRRSVYSPNVDSIWAADLLDVHRYAKQNKNNTFILVMIDLFSKKAWARGLRFKSGPCAAAAIRDVFEKSGCSPSKLWTDEGKEFYNHNVEAVLQQYNVDIYSTHNDPKSAVAERFIRTLRRKIETNYILTSSTNWYNALPQLIEEYNNSKHRTIGMTPEEARRPSNFQKVYRKLYGNPRKDLQDLKLRDRMPAFKIGDKVRISIHKRMFEKGSTANFSEEIFEISDIVQTTQPITYKIIDLAGEHIEGTFYKEQLQKTDQSIYRVDRILRRRTKNGRAEVYVSWKNYPAKFNSWESADTIMRSGAANYRQK